jgi:outer membrane protein assembly factor BamB
MSIRRNNIFRIAGIIFILFFILAFECKKNSLPNIPTAPSGPAGGYGSVFYNFTTSPTDPDGDDVAVRFSWGDGNFSDWSSLVKSGASVTMAYIYDVDYDSSIFQITAQVMDKRKATSDWSEAHAIVILGNRPPICDTPVGLAIGLVNKSCSFHCDADDPDYDEVLIRFDWGDDDTSDWITWSDTHSYRTSGSFYVRAQAKDEKGALSNWSEPHSIFIRSTNQPPNTPSTPNGISVGRVDSSYVFSSSTTDPEGDEIAIRFTWGDGDTSYWSSLTASGNTVSKSHYWSNSDTYYVKAQAKDLIGDTSCWSAPHSIAISYAQGQLKWRYQIDVFMSSPAIGSDGTIYVGSGDNYLYAVNSDGTLKWRYQIGSNIYVGSSPAIGSDGTIYVGSYDAYLFALNPNGTLKWRYQTGDCVGSSPAIGSDGTVYFGSSDHYLYAVNSDGTLKWRYQTGSYVWSSPAIGSDGTIYVGSGDNYLYAVNSNGTLKWRYQTGSYVGSSPAIGSDGTIYFGSYDSCLYALNPDSTLKWRYQTANDVSSSPVIGSDGTIYFGSYDHYLYALNPDGLLKWRYQTADDVSSSPAIDSDGTIYFGSNDHYLYALNSDGSLKWRYQTEDDVESSPAIGPDGTIYVGSYYLFAIQGSGQLANTSWPKFHHDLKNTGRVGGPK